MNSLRSFRQCHSFKCRLSAKPLKESAQKVAPAVRVVVPWILTVENDRHVGTSRNAFQFVDEILCSVFRIRMHVVEPDQVRQPAIAKKNLHVAMLIGPKEPMSVVIPDADAGLRENALIRS